MSAVSLQPRLGPGYIESITVDVLTCHRRAASIFRMLGLVNFSNKGPFSKSWLLGIMVKHVQQSLDKP
jgi:hypothetical protein